jgi:hypothetical protein
VEIKRLQDVLDEQKEELEERRVTNAAEIALNTMKSELLKQRRFCFSTMRSQEQQHHLPCKSQCGVGVAPLQWFKTVPFQTGSSLKMRLICCCCGKTYDLLEYMYKLDMTGWNVLPNTRSCFRKALADARQYVQSERPRNEPEVWPMVLLTIVLSIDFRLSSIFQLNHLLIPSPTYGLPGTHLPVVRRFVTAVCQLMVNSNLWVKDVSDFDDDDKSLPLWYFNR